MTTKWNPAGLASLAMVALIGIPAIPAPAQDFTEAQIQAGLTVWRDNAGCSACHGDLAQGGKMQDASGAEIDVPSLRRTAVLIDDARVISACGIPGTLMPFNLEGAWVTEQCYGIPVAAEPPKFINPGAALTKQQLDDLLAFLFDRVVKKRVITKAMCVEIYGDPAAPECAAYE